MKKWWKIWWKGGKRGSKARLRILELWLYVIIILFFVIYFVALNIITELNWTYVIWPAQGMCLHRRQSSRLIYFSNRTCFSPHARSVYCATIWYKYNVWLGKYKCLHNNTGRERGNILKRLISGCKPWKKLNLAK